MANRLGANAWAAVARARHRICHSGASHSPGRLPWAAGISVHDRRVTISGLRGFGSIGDVNRIRDGNARRTSALAGGLLFAALGGYATYYSQHAYADAPATPRRIRLEEVKQHGQDAEQFWIIRGTRVYDITEWVPNHPGGTVILRAAGGSVDPYWKIFAIHQKKEVYDILEQYYIGDVDPQDLVDGQVPSEHVDDPFETDPKRDERLLVLSDRPCNAETPCNALGEYTTPNDVFYVRNHLWVPHFRTVDDYRVTVELPDGDEVAYSLADLRSRFRAHSVTCVLQCSGNRRAHMSAASEQTQGLPWTVGAIGNAVWTGIRLRDVLADAGFPVDAVPAEIRHAQFSGAEAYGASIPIEKAVDPRGDVLLAFEMNGQPLPRDHGFPVRVLVPGHVAARSVKWVNHIALAEEESPAQWQRRDYKCFPPQVRDATPEQWEAAPAIQITPVQSAITSVRDVPAPAPAPASESEEVVEVRGYAYSGGGRKIVRVDVSADEGASWMEAELLPPAGEESFGREWGWTLWRIAVPRTHAGKGFTVKAVDDAYQTQPESYAATWNFRGNLTGAWHRVEYGGAAPTGSGSGGSGSDEASITAKRSKNTKT